MKLFDTILRIIAAPLVFGISFIAFTGQAFLRTYWFLRYGGEWIQYAKKNARGGISDALVKVVDLLEKQANNESAD